jgi:hypothetical protein
MHKKLKQHIAQMVERNGGYIGGGYHTSTYPLEWNVEIGYSCEWEDALEAARKQFSEFGLDHFPAPVLKRAVVEVKRNYDAYRRWEWVQEDMVRDLNDDDGLRSCSPDVFRKWGIIEPKGGLYFDVKWDLVGRCGKHLVMAEFEGVILRGVRNSDLVEWILNGDDYENVSNHDLRCLAAYIEECDRMFSRKAVKEEFYYKLGWQLACAIYDKCEEREKTNARIAAERIGPHLALMGAC